MIRHEVLNINLY